MRIFVYTVALTLLLLTLFCFRGEAQTLNSSIPPSPTAASMGVYGDIPVSYYTGVPNISVPVYTIKQHGQSIPISLNYHAGGIGQMQEATAVGLGWTINNTAVITRALRQRDDFGSTGYFKSEFRNKSSDGSDDVQPDIFYYNIFGKTGKFILDYPGTARELSGESDIKIDFDKVNGNYWLITMDDGTVFRFEKKEYTRQEVRIPGVKTTEATYVSAWFLSTITQTNGQIITFSYRNSALQPKIYRKYNGESYSRVTNYYPQIYCSAYVGSAVNSFNGVVGVIETKSWTDEVLVEEITFVGGKISFTYSDRIDLETENSTIKSKKLDRVEVYSSSNELLKRFSLTYEYFSSQSSTPELVQPAYISKRLKLVSLCDSGDGTASAICHSFGYNLDGHLLPDKIENYSKYGYPYQASSIGVLNKIIYPTGGEVNFEYGGHKAQIYSGNRIEKIVSKDEIGTITSVQRYDYRKQNEAGVWVDSGKELNPTFVFSVPDKTIVTENCLDGTSTMVTVEYEVTSRSQAVALGESANGAYVGYDQVTVLHGDNGEYGKTSYYYINNIASNRKTFPSGFPATQDNSNGTLLKSEDYVYSPSSPNAYQLVKQVTYEQDFILPTTVIGGVIVHKPTRVYEYYINTISKRLKSEVFITWNNGSEVKETTTYSYQKDLNARGISLFLPTRINKETSSGEIITTRRKYPDEMLDGRTLIAPYLEMRDRNMYNYVIEEEVLVGTVLQKKIYNLYKKDFLSSNLILPSVVQTQHGTEVKEDRVVYAVYDSRGNPLSAAVDGKPLSYIWGYSKQYPIAEVKNTTAINQIAYAGFESNDTDASQSAGNGRESYWDYADEGAVRRLDSYTGRYCYDLSKGNITKGGLGASREYIVSYWIKGNAPLTLTGSSNTMLKGKINKGVQTNEWTFYEHQVRLDNSVILSGTGLLDDLRLYPVEAQMTTYTYDAQGNITSATDANNVTTYYNHDEFGRLKLIRDREHNIVKRYEYNYEAR